MVTRKQLQKAFIVLGARNLRYKVKNDLCYNVQFLIGSNWVKFDKVALLNLQCYHIKG